MSNNEEVINAINNSKYARLFKNKNIEIKPQSTQTIPEPNKSIINAKYTEVKTKYQNTSLDIEAEKYISNLRLVGEYNRWSLKLIQKWLISYYKDKFWINMSIAMLKYGYNLDPSMIQLEICNEFIEGYYIPKEEKIYLCANTLTNYEKNTKFKTALQRYVIRY
jgi:hypothetical protein